MPLVSLREALTRNRAATSPAAADPRLRTRVYPLPRAVVWERVLGAARGQPGWTVVSASAEGGELRAEARTRLLGFVDDVAVRVIQDPSGGARVDAASASRIGRADLGTNARRIARFLHEVDGLVFPVAG